MNIFQAAFLGMVQGLTEFLPVSSSGHLVLFQKIFGITSGALSFDVFVHLGTLVAVIAVFWRDIVSMLKKPFGRLPILLVVGTVPAVITGFALRDFFEHLFITGSTLGIEFLITGAVLVWAEKLSCSPREAKRSGVIPAEARFADSSSRRAGIQSAELCSSKTLSTTTALDAFIIGLAQAVAILPAISRSGLTIAGSLFRKLDREFALKFSFLLSVPAILGSVVLDTADIVKNPDGFLILPTLLGTALAAVSGYFAIRFMLKIFSKNSLIPFAIYVFVLGSLVIIDQFITHIFF